MDISFDFSCLFLVFLAIKELRNLEHEAPLYDLTIATNTKTYIYKIIKILFDRHKFDPF